MKTNVNMIRKMGDFDVVQRTRDGYFDANHLLQQWNKANNQKKQVYGFLRLDSTKEFIDEIKTAENAGDEYLRSRDLKVVIEQKGRRKRKGGQFPDKVWMHPYLYIDFTMWVNPRFKYHVIKFVYDQLIEYRHNAGDNYKSLTSAVSKFNNVDYRQMAKGLNYIIFGEHHNEIRQVATPEQLKELYLLEHNLTFAIDMGLINNFQQLIQNMRQLYHNKWSKFEISRIFQEQS